MKKKLLTPAEAKALEDFVEKNGGQIEASRLLGNIAPATLSRTSNRHTAPSPLLRQKLVENGIIKGEKTAVKA